MASGQKLGLICASSVALAVSAVLGYWTSISGATAGGGQIVGSGGGPKART